MQKSFRQINEVLCKVLAHNICVLIKEVHAFNIHPKFCAESQKVAAFAQNSSPIHLRLL